MYIIIMVTNVIFLTRFTKKNYIMKAQEISFSGLTRVYFVINNNDKKNIYKKDK